MTPGCYAVCIAWMMANIVRLSCVRLVIPGETPGVGGSLCVCLTSKHIWSRLRMLAGHGEATVELKRRQLRAFFNPLVVESMSVTETLY